VLIFSPAIDHPSSGVRICSRFNNGSYYPAGDDHVRVGKGAAYDVNIPWPHGQFGDSDYLPVWENMLMPVAHEYNPDMVLISVGFDSGECRSLHTWNTPTSWSIPTTERTFLFKLLIKFLRNEHGNIAEVLQLLAKVRTNCYM
jgi:acetoin utilization deacetylase AcuC-like enzyme